MAESFNVEKVAHLARLEMTDQERPQFEQQFQKIMELFKSIESVPTEGVAPMVTPHQMHSPLRKDKVDQKLKDEEILANAPDVKDNLFRVPPVV